MSMAVSVAPEIHKIFSGQRLATDITQGPVGFAMTFRVPGHALIFDILIFQVSFTAGAAQAALMKGAAIKGDKLLVDQRSFTGSAGKAVWMPAGTQRFKSVAVNGLVTAFAFHAEAS